MEHPEAQQQLCDLTSGVMTLLLTAIDGKETLSETETRDLLLSIIKTSKPERQVLMTIIEFTFNIYVYFLTNFVFYLDEKKQ